MKNVTGDMMIEVGSILVHSIGCGCDEFYQVVKATEKTVTARRLEYRIVRGSVKNQCMDILPIKDKFLPPSMSHKYIGGYKAGKSVFKEYDENIVKLRISDDGRIGPVKRMIWWHVFDGKKKEQYSP